MAKASMMIVLIKSAVLFLLLVDQKCTCTWLCNWCQKFVL